MASDEPYKTTVIRYYIDTRKLVPSDGKSKCDLPLLEVLSKEQQESIERYFRPADRLMSLASTLIKNVFIHRQAKIPWKEVKISRTPSPHKRPYWEPPSTWNGKGGLEFNVTHQAGLVALIGCITPTVQSSQINTTNLVADNLSKDGAVPLPENSNQQQIRLGIDVSCCNEDKRTPKNLKTQDNFEKWVDIFSEMFSEKERFDMKKLPIIESNQGNDYSQQTTFFQSSNNITTSHGQELLMIKKKLRRFYTYWALKEAYIKMIGEGLLADWLKELEFFNVISPDPISLLSSSSSSNQFIIDEKQKWTSSKFSQKSTKIKFKNQIITNVKMDIISYEEDFIFVTAMKGIVEEEDEESSLQDTIKWIQLDIKNDIQPCVEGRCKCFINT